MNSFVRFIFTLLIIGIVVNLAVVFAANAQSQRRQSIQDKSDREALEALLAQSNHMSRQLDAVVESQRFDQDNKAIETTLLVRQYHSTDQSVPGAVQRVVIPGDSLAVYGVLLEFSDDFAADVPEFQLMRGKQLAYFTFVCGENEKPAPNQPDERFTFFPQWDPPELTRINIYNQRPSIFEVRLWKYIWSRLPEDSSLPWNTDGRHGVRAVAVNLDTATPGKIALQPAVISGVRPQTLYSATVSYISNEVFWRAGAPDRERVRSILEQRRNQDAALQPGAETLPAASSRP
jgi:hypothetical protein